MRWYRAVEPVSRVRRPSIRPASDERRSALVASRSFFLRPRFGWRRAAVRIPTRGVAGSAGAGAGSGSGCRGARDRSRSRARGVRTATRAESEAGTTRRSEMRSSTLARRGGGRRVHRAASGMDASAAPRLGKRATRDAEPLPVGRTRKACRRAGGEMDVSALPVRCLPPLRPSPLPARPTDRKSPRRFFFPSARGRGRADRALTPDLPPPPPDSNAQDDILEVVFGHLAGAASPKDYINATLTCVLGPVDPGSSTNSSATASRRGNNFFPPSERQPRADAPREVEKR